MGELESENIKLVERWIQSQQTGCLFASRLIGVEKRILVVEFSSESAGYMRLDLKTNDLKWPTCMGLACAIDATDTKSTILGFAHPWAGAATYGEEQAMVDFHDIPNPIALKTRPQGFQRMRKTVDELMGGRKGEVDWRTVSFALPNSAHSSAS